MISFDEIRIEFSNNRLGGPVRTTGRFRTTDRSAAERLLKGSVEGGFVASNITAEVMRDVLHFSPLSDDPPGQVGPQVFTGEAQFYATAGSPSWVVQDASGKKFRLALEALP